MREFARRNVRIIAISAALVIAASALAMLFARPKGLQPAVSVSSLPPAVQSAVAKFQDRGGLYIWGENDCSIFVLDYLKASGVPIKRRLTTKELFDVEIMADHGYETQTVPVQIGDIVVFRYMSPKPAGHCGIAVEQDGVIQILHNAASMQGLVLETVEEFLVRAEQFGAPRESVRLFRARLEPKT